MNREGFLLGRSWSAAPGNPWLGLAQFNCLADSLHDSFPRVAKAVLQWPHRRPLLFAEIGRFVDEGVIV